MTDKQMAAQTVRLRWCHHPRDPSKDTPIWVNLKKIDFYWKPDPNYIGPGGTGAAIEGRYLRFGEWVKKLEEIHYISLNYSERGYIEFSDGRHRTAWLRDHGVIAIPILTDIESKQWLLEHCGSDLRDSILTFPDG